MADKKGLIKSKKQMFIVISVFALVMVLGTVTYAFFNYTRTGTANNLGTGQIYFNTMEGPTLNLTNLFPMTSEEAGEANLDSITIVIEGNTTYSDGEEYEISLVDVNNTINGKKIPINYIATYAPNTGKVIGTPSNDYFNAREDKDANIYLLNATGKVEEGKQVLVGYVDNGATGIEGTLTIKVYIDADRIAITDTPDANTEWQQGRTVFTTEEWNSFATTPISFKIRAESNEGIWVEEPAQGTIESCPGCKFMYLAYIPMYTTWNTNSHTPTQITSGLYDNYEELIATTGKNYFLGLKLNNNNEVTNAYACGVKDNVPFCLEGTLNGASETATAYATNKGLLQGTELYNNTCIETVEDEGTENEYIYSECGPWDNSGSVSAYADFGGYVSAGVGNADICLVKDNGRFDCDESVSGGGGEPQQ